MTRDEMNRYLCAIITTLDEVESAPESAIYLGIGRDPDKWKVLKEFLSMSGLAMFAADHTIRLTTAGREMAKKINAFNKKLVQ